MIRFLSIGPLYGTMEPAVYPIGSMPIFPGRNKPADDSADDQQLVQAINAGDRRAFETLYRRYRDWAYRLALRFCRDEASAQDVLQEAFIYVAGKFPGFELTAKFTTFLYPVIRHIAIAQRQKTTRMNLQAHLPETTAPSSPSTPTDLEDLKRVMADLPQAHREVVILRFVDELELNEIAQTMQIPLGTAKSRLHNALKKLRADPRIKKYFQP